VNGCRYRLQKLLQNGMEQGFSLGANESKMGGGGPQS